jgi:predicted Holliday junction resolvase-like endonuclease
MVPLLILVAVLAVALAAVIIGFILYAKDLRGQNKDLAGELKEANAQLEHRTKKAVSSSRTSHVGLIVEQLAPLLPGFPDYNLKDVQWVGGTIDMIVWNGLEAATAAHCPPGAQVEIIFLDVKTGSARVEARQRLIREAIEAGRVGFAVHRFRVEDAVVAPEAENVELTEQDLTSVVWEPGASAEELLLAEPSPEGSRPLSLQEMQLPGPNECP